MNKKLIKILFILCLVGIASSAFLLYQSHQLATKGFGEKSFCNVSDVINCDIVNASSYSEILRVPVSGLALLYYLIVGFHLLISLFFPAPSKGRPSLQFHAHYTGFGDDAGDGLSIVL